MNSLYSQTNLGLFTLERCDDYNSKFVCLPAWRVQSHKIFGWYPVWGCWQFTRLSAILNWLAHVWEDLNKK